MIRQEKLARRLRGAGRVNVDDVPVAFTLRPAGSSQNIQNDNKKTQKSCTPKPHERKPDILHIIANSAQKKLSKETAKAKMMDFRTPKTVRRTPKSVKRKACAEIPAMTPMPVANSSDIMANEPEIRADFSPPLQSSTPEAPRPDDFDRIEVLSAEDCRSPEVDTQRACSPLAMSPATEAQCLSQDMDTAAAPEIVQVQTTTQVSARKRRLDHNDLEVPVQMSPPKKAKRRLKGLLRELGPGASRFIIGAPNFATPARPKITSDHNSSSDRRTSRNLTNSCRRSCRKSPFPLKRAEIVPGVQKPGHRSTTISKTTVVKDKKSCLNCQSLKAWSRWHSTACGSWICHRCHKKDALASSSTKITRVGSGRGRAGFQLSVNEHVLLMARRRQGCSFDVIAKELKKWKTGQSVRSYFNKASTQIILKELDDRVEAMLAQEVPQEHRQTIQTQRKRKNRKIDKSTPKTDSVQGQEADDLDIFGL